MVICGECGKGFPSVADFQAHHHECESLFKKKYNCRLCEKEFPCVADMWDHIIGTHDFERREGKDKSILLTGKLAEQNQELQGQIAELRESIKDALNRISSLNDEAQKSIMTKLNGLAFENKNKSRKVEAGEKPYSCGMCMTRFKSRD